MSRRALLLPLAVLLLFLVPGSGSGSTVGALTGAAPGGKAILTSATWTSGTQLPALTAAATVSMKTIANNTANAIPVQDSSGRLVGDGSQLSNLPGGSPFASDTWTHTWAFADGDPTSVGWSTWNVTAAAPSISSSTKTARDASEISCYLVTPGAGSGESGIRITWGSGASANWELRVRAWIPAAATSVWMFGYNTVDTSGADEWFYINPKAAALALNAASLVALDFSNAWIDWTIRVYETTEGAGIYEVWAGPLLVKSGILTDGAALRSAGRFEFGKLSGASETGGCLASVKLKDNGINEAPPSFVFRAQSIGP